MGVGTPLDILEAVKSGIDLFIVLFLLGMQERILYTTKGIVKIRNSKYALDISQLMKVVNVTLVVISPNLFYIIYKKEKRCWVLNSIQYIIYFFI